MKKSRQLKRTRLWVEELEPRVVLSPVAVLSTNWSGYAAQTSLKSPAANAVSAVYGSWTVPTVTGSGTAYTSVWVGIDGYSSNSVEQIGTDSDLVNGVPTYYAWYEMYPHSSFNVATITVNAGDTISASVVYNAAKKDYTLSLTDGTQTFNTTQALPRTRRSSAEWVVEAPSSWNGVLPLANFSTVNFTNASATINGTQSSIDGYNAANPASPLWQYTPINMVTHRGAVQATTGSLTDNTTGTPATSSFSVTYTAPPPPAPTPHRHHWWWYSANEAVQGDAAANNPVVPASSVVPVTAAPSTPTNYSAAAPPVVIPLNPAPAPWMSLTGPAASAENEGDPDAILLDANFVLARDLFHPTAFALSTATPNAATQSVQPQPVAEPTWNNAVLIAETPAVSSAPPASQPEPRGSFVTKTMSKAFWLVAGLAFVSHSAFVRGKRQTARNQDGDERS